jgi:hypothetical protein
MVILECVIFMLRSKKMVIEDGSSTNHETLPHSLGFLLKVAIF